MKKKVLVLMLILTIYGCMTGGPVLCDDRPFTIEETKFMKELDPSLKYIEMERVNFEYNSKFNWKNKNGHGCYSGSEDDDYHIWLENVSTVLLKDSIESRNYALKLVSKWYADVLEDSIIAFTTGYEVDLSNYHEGMKDSTLHYSFLISRNELAKHVGFNIRKGNNVLERVRIKKSDTVIFEEEEYY